MAWNDSSRPHVDDDQRHCCDCGAAFVWSVDEQHFYAERGFPPPKRCRPCRALKRQRFAAGASDSA